ncbi:MAG: hypothetical protein COT17_05935 [Elusimicrobia bacterium CG08_land_8_20_14_0_20_51_18]|nr:MAG: hypothetical protein COT17_05935 [Elusimicrobia bacterium CG08_land_8_20_14_0_20_51_18]
MSILVNLVLGLFLHTACLVAYPETGKLGFAFLFVSFMLWTSLSIFLKPPMSGFKLDTVIFCNILYFFFMITSLLTLTPQQDSVSILNKIIKGQYPDKKSYYKGLLRIGIDDRKLLREIIEEEGKGKNLDEV